MKRLLLAAALVAVASSSLAGGKPHHYPPPNPTAKATATSASSAKAEANPTINVNPTIAPSFAPTNTVAANASNDGVSQAVSFSSPRQAPSLGQGSLFIPDCGAAGNAGGSGAHGAAFLGFAWTPHDCKLLQTAAAYSALGMKNVACEMVNGTSAAKARFKELGIHPPLCGLETGEPEHTEVIPQVPLEPQEMRLVVSYDGPPVGAQPCLPPANIPKKKAKKPQRPVETLCPAPSR